MVVCLTFQVGQWHCHRQIPWKEAGICFVSHFVLLGVRQQKYQFTPAKKNIDISIWIAYVFCLVIMKKKNLSNWLWGSSKSHLRDPRIEITASLNSANVCNNICLLGFSWSWFWRHRTHISRATVDLSSSCIFPSPSLSLRCFMDDSSFFS